MALCATLDQQLALGDAIQFHIKDPELNRVVILFKWCWDCNIKESKCHINEIVTPTFFQCVETPSAFQPVRKWVRRYVLPPSFRRPIFLPVPCGRRSMWLTGPMVRPTGRGHGYRPDAILSRNRKQVCFVEAKSPGSTHTAKEYLNDHWNLANFAKDAIDLFRKEGLPIRKVAAIQVFGKCIMQFVKQGGSNIPH